jgi:hypothetical protein
MELQQRGRFGIFFGRYRAMRESLRIDTVSGLACAWPSLPSTERDTDNRRTNICTSTFLNGLICNSVDNCRSLLLGLGEARCGSLRIDAIGEIACT